jgi:predicted esterase
MLASLLAIAAFHIPTVAAEIPPIKRVLPPEGLEIPADVRERLETRLEATKKRLDEINSSFKEDVKIFTKAVELALLHREFYTPKDFAKADWALDQANQRLDLLADAEFPWTRSTGLVVRGCVSSIDFSSQPYGLVIPKDHDFEKPCPLYVWLHGRGDKATDLHFLHERATKVGQIAPPGAIVVHPFGRHCVGWKHAGEIDVLDVVKDVKQRYKIDPARVVLIGFSMGGAGAWHIGAHYNDRWVAVSPGAGFAETARYQKLTPDRYPPSHEQTLWGLYDVPGYVRNLFNTDTIAYSGELDKQIQAARVMEEAFRSEGRELTQMIGPGVEHKYQPEVLAELLKRLAATAAKGQTKTPREVHWQSRTLRYNQSHWVEVYGLGEHWKDARVDAALANPEEIKATTKNVTLVMFDPQETTIKRVSIDGQEVLIPPRGDSSPPGITLRKSGDVWRHDPDFIPVYSYPQWTKQPGRTGPIDDAFFDQFLVVTPTGKSKNAVFQAWVDFELAHFRDRWRALMRADLPEIRDVDFKPHEMRPYCNLVFWGDADSNLALKHVADELPVRFADGKWSYGGHVFDGNRYAPALIFPPNKLLQARYYIVLNSGLTFREGHDRTNSLQNPKLPDWAIIDMTQPPDALAPGRIHDAGFFDEEWKLKGPVKGPEAAP